MHSSLMYMYACECPAGLYRNSWEKPVLFTTLIIMCSLHPMVLLPGYLIVRVHVHVNAV